jgi:hypothetical protein
VKISNLANWAARSDPTPNKLVTDLRKGETSRVGAATVISEHDTYRCTILQMETKFEAQLRAGVVAMECAGIAERRRRFTLYGLLVVDALQDFGNELKRWRASLATVFAKPRKQ